MKNKQLFISVALRTPGSGEFEPGTVRMEQQFQVTGTKAEIIESFDFIRMAFIARLESVESKRFADLSMAFSEEALQDAIDKTLEDIAANRGIPIHILKGQVGGIDPDPQSFETCDTCKGHGYLQSDVPTSTNQQGEVFYERIDCPDCAGAGKVGV